MLILLRGIMRSATDRRLSYTATCYETALKALHSLQSNAAYLQTATKQPPWGDAHKMESTREYLIRSGTTLEELDRLSVIHVAGTKGKGSACAFTESILRNHGYTTGFFSSPHLVSVRERIKINGEPLSETQFSHYFWKIYNRLDERKTHETDMPTYFKFLTILMFNIFLEVNVDVAILEVGIGGECDCTNIVRNPVCVGITSLGFDHTYLLGDTIEEIAFQKSGIFKPNTVAFTVPQVSEAMCVLEKRAIERNCTLRLIPEFDQYSWENISPMLGQANNVRQQNASLAIEMAAQWIVARNCQNSLQMISNYGTNGRILYSHKTASEKFLSPSIELPDVVSMDKIALALSSCKWPGRMQILRSSIADFFLDGAHTSESMECCLAWYRNITQKTNRRKFLMFNTTRGRDLRQFLKSLRSLHFDRVYFVPNHSGIDNLSNETNNADLEAQSIQCKKNAELWGEGAVVSDNVSNVLEDIEKLTRSEINGINQNRVQVLVTGSLHLVGAVLTILDPNLTMSTEF